MSFVPVFHILSLEMQSNTLDIGDLVESVEDLFEKEVNLPHRQEVRLDECFRVLKH